MTTQSSTICLVLSTNKKKKGVVNNKKGNFSVVLGTNIFGCEGSSPFRPTIKIL
jgi:hypothetical protein